VLLGDGEPEEPEFTELPDDAGVDPLAPVPLGGVGHDLAVDEPGRKLPDGLLFRGEGEVHGGRLPALNFQC
jgi:hypothetical protein